MQSRRLVALSGDCQRGAPITASHFSSSQLHSSYQQRLSSPSLFFSSPAITDSIPLPIYQPAVRIEDCSVKPCPSGVRQISNPQKAYQIQQQQNHHATTSSFASQHIATFPINIKNIDSTNNSTDLSRHTVYQTNGRVFHISSNTDDNAPFKLDSSNNISDQSTSFTPELSRYPISIEQPKLQSRQCVEPDNFRSILKGKIITHVCHYRRQT